MMYPYLTLDDDTEIVHSEMREDGTVKVYIEKPDETDCFHNAVCVLPRYEWSEINGFSSEELTFFQKILENNAHMIIELSQCGGFDHAAGF
ncbi:MAG: hypothetical protein IJK24_02155 [Oscillospiraceae bacterium]|jgi:hypothetical protein|nr:hypothetical protein [Oscillospiraceae bacterium]